MDGNKSSISFLFFRSLLNCLRKREEFFILGNLKASSLRFQQSTTAKECSTAMIALR